MVRVLWFLAGLTYHSFLNLGKIITTEKCYQQINKIHQKLQLQQLALVNRKKQIQFYNKAIKTTVY